MKNYVKSGWVGSVIAIVIILFLEFLGISVIPAFVTGYYIFLFFPIIHPIYNDLIQIGLKLLSAGFSGFVLGSILLTDIRNTRFSEWPKLIKILTLIYGLIIILPVIVLILAGLTWSLP